MFLKQLFAIGDAVNVTLFKLKPPVWFEFCKCWILLVGRVGYLIGNWKRTHRLVISPSQRSVRSG